MRQRLGVPQRQSHCHSGMANLPSESYPLVTPYLRRLSDLLCCVYMFAYCLFDLSVYYMFFQYFDTVGWVF